MIKMNLKRILIIFILGMFIFTFIDVKADNITYNDDSTAYYKPVETLMEGSYENTSYKKINAVTGYNNKESKQLVYTYVQNQTKDSKVVTWAIKKDSGKLKNAPVTAIAEDYEYYHDDWIVVGGINADQYTTGFGTNVASNGKDFYSPQTYYPFIADGEGWFAISPLPYYGHNVAGFLQDGSDDPIVSGSASLNNGEIKLAGLFLYILDEEGNRINKFEICNFNESPKLGETTLWTSCFTAENEFKEITIRNKCYAVLDAERAYASNSIEYSDFKDKNAYNAFFGKGKISYVGENILIGYGDFAVETTDSELEKCLDKDVRILVQYEYEGVLGEVESATGYHTIQKMNGVDTAGVGEYNVLPYPRSVVGRTSDGKIVLLAVDGKAENQGRTGTRHWETNAILNSLGVVEAYQMDGGGSVTAIIRNEKGGFDVINKPADGSARSVLTALLLVERKKPEISGEINIINRDKVIFDIKAINSHGYDIDKVILSINNEEYTVHSGEESIMVAGLDVNKEYSYQIKVIYNNEELVIKDSTIFIEPQVPTVKKITEIEEGTFSIEFEDIDNVLVDYYIEIENEKFYRDINSNIKIKKVEKKNSYIVITYKKGNIEYQDVILFKPYNYMVPLDNILNDIDIFLKDIYN